MKMINSELRELKIIENELICKNLISHIMFFIMFLKQTTAKVLIYKVEARLCYACFYAKISESFNKNYKPFSSCRSKTSDGNTHKQYSQCMNTVLKNMNANWKLLL